MTPAAWALQPEPSGKVLPGEPEKENGENKSEIPQRTDLLA